eukprot:145467_1
MNPSSGLHLRTKAKFQQLTSSASISELETQKVLKLRTSHKSFKSICCYLVLFIVLSLAVWIACDYNAYLLEIEEMQNNFLINIKTQSKTNKTHPIQLKQWQIESLDLYERFDKLLNELNISYWANGGTLIGAMRNKGFIKAEVGDHDMDFDTDIIHKRIIYNHTDYAKQKYNIIIHPEFGEIDSFMNIILMGHKCIGGEINDDNITNRMYGPFNGGAKFIDGNTHRNIDLFFRTKDVFVGFYSMVYGSRLFHFDYELICPNDVFPTYYTQFENIKIPIPHNAEHVLDVIYGKDQWRKPWRWYSDYLRQVNGVWACVKSSYIVPDANELCLPE